MKPTNAAVLKAGAILDYLASNGRGQRLKDIAVAVALHESNVSRLLNSLTILGYVQQNPVDLTYWLGWKILALTRAVDKKGFLVETSRPHLVHLAERIANSVNLSILHDDQALCLACIIPVGISGVIYTSPGVRLPLHATAMGKALIAHLPDNELDALLQRLKLERLSPATITDLAQLRTTLKEVCQCGYAVDQGEFSADLRCVAAPIIDASGMGVAAISVTVRQAEFPPEREKRTISELIATAHKISQTVFAPADSD